MLEKQSPLVLLEVSGVGYELCMPITYFYQRLELGQKAIVFNSLCGA